MPTLAKTKHKDPAVVSITAQACTADSAAAEKPAPACISPRVRLHIALDDAAGDRAAVKLTWQGTNEADACSPAASAAVRQEPDRSDAAVSISEGSACENSAAATQPPGSRECSSGASLHMDAESRSCRTSASGGPASSSAPLAGELHELLAVLLAPLRLKGDYCNVAVLNASEATLGQMQKIEAGAEELLVDDSEVIRILNGHIGRPVSLQLDEIATSAVPCMQLHFLPCMAVELCDVAVRPRLLGLSSRPDCFCFPVASTSA